MGQRIVPFIGYEDAASAIEWLGRAFGFSENRAARHEENGTITMPSSSSRAPRSTCRCPPGTRTLPG